MLDFLRMKINNSNPIDLFLDILLWIILPFVLFLVACNSKLINGGGDEAGVIAKVLAGITNTLKSPFGKNASEHGDSDGDASAGAASAGGDKSVLAQVLAGIKKTLMSLFENRAISATLFSISFIAFAYLIYFTVNSTYIKNKFELINLFYSKYFILGIPFGILFMASIYIFRKKILNFLNDFNNMDGTEGDELDLKIIFRLLINHWFRLIKYGMALAVLIGLSVLLFKSKILMLLMLLTMLVVACIYIYITFVKKINVSYGDGDREYVLPDAMGNFKNIPKLFYKFIQYIINSKPESNVIIILIVECIVLFSLLLSHIFGKNAHKLINRSKTISHKKVYEQNEIIQDKKLKLRKSVFKIKSKLPNVDWEPILKHDLWKPVNDTKLEDYINKYDFKKTKEEGARAFFNKIFNINKLSYVNALVYIKTNAPKLIKLNNEIYNLNNKKYDNTKIESVIIQKDKVYTDKKSTIFIENKNKNLFNYNYALSSWIYINNQSEKINTLGNKFVSVINYGNKPNILYNVKKNILKIVTTNGKSIKTIYESNSIQLQKWNHVVVNYEAGVMDIFINGDLVSSVEKIVPYMKNDPVTIGESGGISGSMRDTIAFSKPLGLKQIAIIYNGLKSR